MKLSFRERFLILKGRIDWKAVLLFITLMEIFSIIYSLITWTIGAIIFGSVLMFLLFTWTFAITMYPQLRFSNKNDEDIKLTKEEKKMLDKANKFKKRNDVINEIIKGSD